MRQFLTGTALGAPWFLAFAPFSHWWLALGLLLLLFALLVRLEKPSQAFWLGFGFGWGAFCVGVSWLYISLHTYGGLPSVLAVLSVAAFSAYLALFSAMASLLLHRCVVGPNGFKSAGAMAAFVWAAGWTFFEWLRGTFLTGFAWLNAGDTLVDSPLAGLLPWLGNYGAWALLLWLAICVLLVSTPRLAGVPRRNSFITGAVALGCVVGLLSLPVQTEPTPNLQVAGVQTNVDQSIKFDPDLIVSNMEKAFSLGDLALDELGKRGGGLVLFPETVNPLIWTDTPRSWRERFQSFAQPQSSQVIMGTAIEENGRYFNSIVKFDGLETDEELVLPQNRHDKRHLVPFGEFIPWGFAWFVALLDMPMGEFTRGSGPLHTFSVNGNQMASTVCYEDIFSGEFAGLLRSAQAEPTYFINLSNLAWFGQSWALDQHAQMGRTRSAEHQKPGLRVTNTGMSGLIDHHGQWVVKAQPGADVVWLAELPGRTGRTFFAKFGPSLWYGMWIVGLVCVMLRLKALRAYNKHF